MKIQAPSGYRRSANSGVSHTGAGMQRVDRAEQGRIMPESVVRRCVLACRSTLVNEQTLEPHVEGSSWTENRARTGPGHMPKVRERSLSSSRVKFDRYKE